MGILNGRDKNGNLKILVNYYSGLPHQYAGGIYRFLLDTENRCIVIRNALEKKQAPLILSFNKIIRYSTNSTDSIVKKPKRVRAAFWGGLIGGGVGAIINSNNAKPTRVYFKCKALAYRSKDGNVNEITFIPFSRIRNRRFFAQLSNYVDIKPDKHKDDNNDPNEPIYL